MIQYVVFSKDRAQQVNFLLKSLQLNLSKDIKPSLLYTSSSEQYEKGYSVIKELNPGCQFVREEPKVISFKDNLMSMIEKDSNQYICFFTDDSYIYRATPEWNEDSREIILESLKPNDFCQTCCFSLRLGLNIDDVKNRISKINYQSYEDLIRWDFKLIYDQSYAAYPLSVDGHIFHKDVILPIFRDVEFDNPNLLEGRMAGHNYYPRLKNYIASFKQSCLVINPVNRVQDTFDNWYGKTFPTTQEYLNELLLADVFINPHAMYRKPEDINSCHTELQYKYYQREMR